MLNSIDLIIIIFQDINVWDICFDVVVVVAFVEIYSKQTGWQTNKSDRKKHMIWKWKNIVTFKIIFNY